MIRLIALWAVFLAAVILFLVLREERLAAQGKVPMGRLRRLWFVAERRRAPRYRVDLPIRYRRLEASSLANGRTRDLSQTGVGLVLEERFAQGTQLSIEFLLAGEAPLEVTGQVVWSREVPHPEKPPSSDARLFFAGIQFHKMDPEKEKRVIDVLEGRRGVLRETIVRKGNV